MAVLQLKTLVSQIANPILRSRLLWRYASYISLMVAVLLAVSGGLGSYIAYREATTAELRIQQERAVAAANQMAGFMERTEEMLRWVGSTAPAKAGDVSLSELRSTLLQLMQRLPHLTEIIWLDRAGHEQVFVSRFAPDTIATGRSRSDDPRFIHAVREGYFVGPAYFRLGTEPYVSLAVTGTGTDSPVLIAEVNLKFTADVISRQRFGQKGIAYVVDRNGQLLSHPDISFVLAHTDMGTLDQVRMASSSAELPQGVSFASARDLNGNEVMGAAARLSKMGWTVFVEVPRSEALAPVYELLANTALLLLIGILVSIAASIALARRFAKPIMELERGAEALGEGRMGERIHVQTGGDLEALTMQFNRMAERLQNIYTTLEDRVAERTRDLIQANLAKTRFLAAASHDLRQPVHALGLYAGQLRRAELSPDAAYLTQQIERSVTTLRELFDALLDISRLDAGAVQARVQPMPVNPLLDRLRNEFTPIAESKELRLRVVPSRLWIRSDPAILERIIMNLISNAIRYTSHGGVVVGCRRKGDTVSIHVMDTGVGMDASELPLIFQEFYQANESGLERTSGLGLGLAIVERNARLLGHGIDVTSEPGRGSRFTLTAVRAQPMSATVADMTSPTQNLQDLRVLVVDDEPDARDAMDRTLRAWGCIVALAANGDDAAGFTLNGKAPDVVLCDLNLAGTELGIDVVMRLRAHWGIHLRAVFITAETDSEQLHKARQFGDPVLNKPVRPAKLRALLEAMTSSPLTRPNP